MPVRHEHDLVIGAGPGGYAAAIRRRSWDGCRVRRARGGPRRHVPAGRVHPEQGAPRVQRLRRGPRTFRRTRVRFGDVTLDLAAMLRRKDETVQGLTSGVDSLFRKHRVARYTGHGRIIGPEAVVVENGSDGARITARRILIATGSTSASLPGVTPDGDRIGTSTEALGYPDVPGHLVVIGAGYIGLELGSVWRRLGAKVTIVEYLDRILPGMDTEVAAGAKRLFEAQGLAFRLRSRVTGARVEPGGCVVECEGAEPIRGDRVLVAAGRSPVTGNLGLDALGITPTSTADRRGRAVRDGGRRRLAVGDVVRGPMLAHKASEEGSPASRCSRAVMDVDYDAIPSVVYTSPEISAVGRTEEQLQAAGINYRKGVFPFRANGRARALGQTEGHVKVLADTKTDRVLGVHILGPRAGDLIAEAASAMAFGASSEDIARTCHAHPTLAEAIREAALAVAGRALHL